MWEGTCGKGCYVERDACGGVENFREGDLSQFWQMGVFLQSSYLNTQTQGEPLHKILIVNQISLCYTTYVIYYRNVFDIYIYLVKLCWTKLLEPPKQEKGHFTRSLWLPRRLPRAIFGRLIKRDVFIMFIFYSTCTNKAIVLNKPMEKKTFF